MNFFKNLRNLSHRQSRFLLRACGGMAALLLIALFISGGGIGRVSGGLNDSFASVSPNSQTASWLSCWLNSNCGGSLNGNCASYLSGTAVSPGGNTTLTWGPTTNGVGYLTASFLEYYNSSTGAFVTINQIPSDGGSQIYGPVNDNTTFRVTCINYYGTGQGYANTVTDVRMCPANQTPSGTTCVAPTPIPAPNPPASVTGSCANFLISNVTYQIITLSWTPPASGSPPISYYARIETPGYASQAECSAINSGWTWAAPDICYHDGYLGGPSGGMTNMFGAPGATYNAWVHAGNGDAWVANGSPTPGITGATYATPFTCPTVPTISVVSSGNPAEPSTTGTFTISRTNTTSQILVPYTMSGTATRGSSIANDYKLTLTTGGSITQGTTNGNTISGTTTINAGVASVAITLTPWDDATAEGSETATFTLSSPVPGFDIVTAAANLSITDNDSSDICTDITGLQPSTPSGCQVPSPSPGICIPTNYTWTGSVCSPAISISATDAAAAEAGPGTGAYTVTRSSSTGTASVTYTMSNTATRGSSTAYDYQLTVASGGTITQGTTNGTTTSGVITFNSGVSSVVVTLTPWNDATAEGTETATITLSSPSAGFVLGSSTGNIVIADDDTDFVLSAANVSVTQGTTNTNMVGATLTGGIASSVGSFTTSALPTGVTITFSPSSCTLSTSTCTNMSITATGAAAPGTYPITVYGTGGGVTRNVTFNLTVAAAAAFNFTLTAPNKTVTQGISGTLTVAATLTAGLATSIGSFTTTGLPTGVTASFSPSTCTPTSASCTVMTITPISTATPGSYTVTVYATGGGVTRSDTLVLTVSPDISQPPIMSVAAISATASEPSTPGIFEFSRTGDVSAGQVVHYVFTGSAAASRYVLSGTCGSITAISATIPVGNSTCTVIVTPIDNLTLQPTESIILTILP